MAIIKTAISLLFFVYGCTNYIRIIDASVEARHNALPEHVNQNKTLISERSVSRTTGRTGIHKNSETRIKDLRKEKVSFHYKSNATDASNKVTLNRTNHNSRDVSLSDRTTNLNRTDKLKYASDSSLVQEADDTVHTYRASVIVVAGILPAMICIALCCLYVMPRLKDDD